MGCTLEEAEEFLKKYVEGLPTLHKWKMFMKREAERSDLFTYFGRPRRMARYFTPQSSWGQRGFGKRTALNTVVQGCAADVLRLVMGRILTWSIAHPVEALNFRTRNTVHDELNFSVKKYWLNEFMEVVPRLMTVDFQKDWGINLDVEVSIGNNWGECVPYEYHDGVYTPNGRLYHRDVVTKRKSA